VVLPRLVFQNDSGPANDRWTALRQDGRVDRPISDALMAETSRCSASRGSASPCRGRCSRRRG